MFTPSDIKLDPQCDTGVACDIFERVSTYYEPKATYEATCLNIQPYRKKTKKAAELLSNDVPRRKQYEVLFPKTTGS